MAATDNKVATADEQQADAKSVGDLKNIESIEEAQIRDERNGQYTRS